MKKGVVLVVHGSRLKGFDAPIKKIVSSLKKAGAAHWVLVAYLEINKPSLGEVLARLVKKGATAIQVLPYFLLVGSHVKKDIPELIRQARKKYGKSLHIKLCPYLGFDKRLVSLLLSRLKEKR